MFSLSGLGFRRKVSPDNPVSGGWLKFETLAWGRVASLMLVGILLSVNTSLSLIITPHALMIKTSPTVYRYCIEGIHC